MNITYSRRPRRKSMLGSRLSILRDNVELSHEDMKPPQPPQENTEVKSFPREIKPFNDSQPDNVPTENNESLNQVLSDIEILLDKNSQTLKTLLQEREQLEKIERMLKEKINLSKDKYNGCKENQPPKGNTVAKSKQSFDEGGNSCNEDTPTKSLSVLKNDRNDDKFVAPHNPAIDMMRSSLKYLKTPRQSRQTRKSIMLTPHSFSFSIQKQFESLNE